MQYQLNFYSVLSLDNPMLVAPRRKISQFMLSKMNTNASICLFVYLSTVYATLIARVSPRTVHAHLP